MIALWQECIRPHEVNKLLWFNLILLPFTSPDRIQHFVQMIR